MPVIYMKHPIHGTKVATMDLEAEEDERNGWERYTPGEESPQVAVNELTARRRRRESANVYHSR
jgi:hypothetical protein